MLSQHWSRAIDSPRCARVLDGEANSMDAPAKRMLDLDIHITCADLWMLIDLVESQYWPSRNFSLLKQLQPFFCGPRLQDLCEGIHEGRKVRHAITVGRKEWILQQVWATQGLDKAFPVALVRCSNGNPAIGCCEYLIWCRYAMRCS